jgi:hypothetical protein
MRTGNGLAPVASLLALLLVAANCEQCAQVGDPRRGNVDRVSDLVVVEATDGHSYVVSANPELLHLRILDLSDGRFLTGPNRYFPLSIPVGNLTRRLAMARDRQTEADDPTRVYAVDSADDTLFVVRTVEDSRTPFVVIGAVPTGRGPADVAVVRLADGSNVAAITFPDSGEVELIQVDGNGAEVARSALPLTDVMGDGARPDAIVADPFGRGFVVADGDSGVVAVIDVNDAGVGVIDRSVSVGGPVTDLSAGVVDVGDGLAPVVLAMVSDLDGRPAVQLLRLFRPGFVEDRVALLGGAELPNLGVTAYVPDARSSAAEVTVCCRGLDAGRIDDGEATTSFAAVSLADGRLLYLQLAAPRLDGLILEDDRRVVRLVDDDAASPGPPEGINVNADENLWSPAEGGGAFRPSIAFATVDNLGTPPFVPLVRAGTTLLAVYDGELPGVRRLRGTWASGPLQFEATVNVANRDVRVGDIAQLLVESPRLDCDDVIEAKITAVSGATISLAAAGGEFDDDESISDAENTGCLQGGGDVRVTVLAQGAFVVTEDGVARGRMRALTDGDDADDGDAFIDLAGVRVSARAAAAGLPVRGSRLAIPLDPRVTTLDVNLPVGQFAAAALVPTAVVGGTVIIPDAEIDGATIAARRLVISAGGANPDSGLPLLMTCDEGETSLGRVEAFN